MHQSLLSVAGLAAAVNAAAISIAVGNGGLTFSPNDVKAAVGDTLQFHFYSGAQSHNVVSGTFESPCTPAAAPFFSGTQAGDSKGDTTFLVNVTSTDPIYFYCAVAKHCINGMVGVVNGPAGKSATEYKAAAAKAAAASAPSAPTGGVLTTIDDSKVTSAASSGSATSAPATTSGSATKASTGSSTGTATGASAGSTSAAATGAATTSRGASNVTGTSTAPTSAATTKSDASRRGEMSVFLGMSAVIGGLVAMMI
ncbi:Cupredoxin [Halenospora varia]|nr:Cupredoxin [Halenospora varia]